MAEHQEITKKEWKKSLLLIVVLVVIITIGAFVLLPYYWYGFVILVVASIVVVIVIVAREEKPATYKCPKCGQEFTISSFKNVFAPHGVTKKEGKWYEWKHLECPMCHEKARMFPMPRESTDVTMIYNDL